MMSMINPNADTPMIKMMMSERIPPTTEVNPALHEAGCPKRCEREVLQANIVSYSI